jgi:hypothetical protein
MDIYIQLGNLGVLYVHSIITLDIEGENEVCHNLTYSFLPDQIETDANAKLSCSSLMM